MDNSIRRLAAWLTTSQVRRVAPYFVAAFTLCMVASLFLTWRAFVTPELKNETIVVQTLESETSFDYSAIPLISTLFPSQQPLGRVPRYLLKLTESFNVMVRSTVSSEPSAQIEGVARLVLRLVAGGLWEKEFVLVPDTPFSGNGRVDAINVSLPLPIQEIFSVIEKVEKEADIAPTTYSFYIAPVINAKTAGHQGLTLLHTPQFSFRLTSRELTPRGLAKDDFTEHNVESDVIQRRAASAKQSNTIPQYVPFFVWPLPVKDARITFGILSTLHILVALGGAYLRSKIRRPASELTQILTRYRSRIIPVASSAFEDGRVAVPVASFQALLRLADEKDSSILAVERDGMASPRLCVLADGTMYHYDAMMAARTVRADRHMAPGATSAREARL